MESAHLSSCNSTILCHHAKDLITTLTDIKNRTNLIITEQQKLLQPCLAAPLKKHIGILEADIQRLWKPLIFNLICFLIQIRLSTSFKDTSDKYLWLFILILIDPAFVSFQLGMNSDYSDLLKSLEIVGIADIMPLC